MNTVPFLSKLLVCQLPLVICWYILRRTEDILLRTRNENFHTESFSPFQSHPSVCFSIYFSRKWHDHWFLGFNYVLFDELAAGSGKLITWGSADDQGQSYLTSGKHGVCGKYFLHGLIYVVPFEWFCYLLSLLHFSRRLQNPFCFQLKIESWKRQLVGHIVYLFQVTVLHSFWVVSNLFS